MKLVSKVDFEKNPLPTFRSLEETQDYTQLIRIADKAMYLAKEAGKNTVIIENYTAEV